MLVAVRGFVMVMMIVVGLVVVVFVTRATKEVHYFFFRVSSIRELKTSLKS